jgi:hypothetical protein
MERAVHQGRADSSRPFKKVYCDWRARIFRELKGARLAVWMYHYLRSDSEDNSHPSLYTISNETGYSESTVKTARGWLRENGWLITVVGSRQDDHGRFKVPVEKSIFPESADHASSENRASDALNIGKHDSGKIKPWEEPTAHFPAVAKATSEVDTVVEVDSVFVDSEEESRNKNISNNNKTAAAAVDSVFTSAKDIAGRVQVQQTGKILDRDTFAPELRKSHTTPYCKFEATKSHIDQAWERAQKVGPNVFIRAYEYWTLSEPEETFRVKMPQKQVNPITCEMDSVFEPVAWPLKKFLSLGIDTDCIEKVRPYAHIAQGETLRFLVDVTPDEEPLDIAPLQVEALSAILDEYLIEDARGGFFRSGGLEDFLAHARQYIEEWETGLAAFRAKSAKSRAA